MKRFLSVVLMICLLAGCIPSLAEEEKKEGLFSTIGGFISDAWNDTTEFVGNTASDVGEWAAQAGVDAWDWMKNAGADAWDWTKIAGADAWNWTKTAGVDAWDWTKNAGTDAWNWTTGAAADAGSWISENASKVWNVTTKEVTGTWNDIFGKADQAGPHHLSVTSPIFKAAKLIDSWTDESGICTECFNYDNTYDITLITTARPADLMPPSVGEMDFADLVSSCFDETVLLEGKANGIGVRAMAQELRFQAVLNNRPLFGRAIGIWTDHYITVMVVSVEAEVTSYGIDINEIQKADQIIGLWMQTLSVCETKAYEAETFHVSSNQQAAGSLTYSNVRTANRIFDEERFHTNQGHGFAAERGNNLIDRIRGVFTREKAKILGDNNAKDGPDRVIEASNDTKTLIQSKYWKDPAAAVRACFDNGGKFRYIDGDGIPMKIEVPRDQYDAAVRQLQQYIDGGQVSGIPEGTKAKDIIKKGHLTYNQAKRLAKAGTLESITYDALNGAVECASSFGISAVVDFAVGLWNGSDVPTALKQSVYTGLEVGGTSFVISVLSSQLSKTGLNSLLVGSSEAITKMMGLKAAAVFANAFRSGGKIYGAAAMRSAAKLLRGNVITATVTLIVTSVPDIAETFRGRISGKQLLKNTTETAGGIAGAIAGYWGGAALGNLILPGGGTNILATIGGIVGSTVGSYTVQFATGKLGDLIIKDDADEMLDIIADEYKNLAEEYLLSEEESDFVNTELESMLSADELKNMFTFSDRNLYAGEIILRPIIVQCVGNRALITLPDNEEYQDAMIEVMEDIYDEENAEEAAVS